MNVPFRDWVFHLETTAGAGNAGAASQPFRDTRPLLQETAILCRSGLVSRKGRKAAPAPVNLCHMPSHPISICNRSPLIPSTPKQAKATACWASPGI
ncbi:hypothetical protein EI693_13815 [Pseudomonas oryziphila]|uniref:Uncharacterized protein n=1 Tax=Pseudomonas oryziphila TaxID=2894079 RepID=A0ABN5TGR1_9PSED|nr:hypothetical protein EI693_13815 [Pseudomonas oryziphila]